METYRVPIVHFIYRMVQDQAAAEELAADLFARVYRINLRATQPDCTTRLFRKLWRFTTCPLYLLYTAVCLAACATALSNTK